MLMKLRFGLTGSKNAGHYGVKAYDLFYSCRECCIGSSTEGQGIHSHLHESWVAGHRSVSNPLVGNPETVYTWHACKHAMHAMMIQVIMPSISLNG